MTLSEVKDDNSGRLYVTDQSVLIVHKSLNTDCFVAENATLQFANMITSHILKEAWIKGDLNLKQNKELKISGSLLYDNKHPLIVPTITVLKSGNLKTVGSLLLNSSEINISGKFSADILITDTWKSLYIGPKAEMSFDPYKATAKLGNSIVITGKLKLSRILSFTTPCKLFVIDGGILDMKGSEPFEISCENVTINAKFSPKNRLSLKKIKYFQVGKMGDLTFDPGSNFQSDISVIDGGFKPLQKFTIIGQQFHVGRTGMVNLAGILSFDAKRNTHYADCQNSSVIDVPHIEVNGAFDAKTLIIKQNLQILIIGDQGNITLYPCASLLSKFTNINGTLMSLRNMNIKGINLYIGPQGILNVNYKRSPIHDSEGCQMTSVVMSHLTMIEGTVNAGSINLTAAYLNVSSSGRIDVSSGGHLSRKGKGKFPNFIFKMQFKKI